MTFSGRKPSQDANELTWFIRYLNRVGARSYLEIGARHGDAFHEVMTHLPEGSLGVVVDKPGGLWGRVGSLRSLNRAADDLRRRGYIIKVIVGDSKSPDVIRQAAEFAPYDAIFIDGDHTMAGVKADFSNYRGLGKVIGFHDIAGQGQRERGGNTVDVPHLWNEIKHSGCEEFITPGSRMGIGVWTSQ